MIYGKSFALTQILTNYSSKATNEPTHILHLLEYRVQQNNRRGEEFGILLRVRVSWDWKEVTYYNRFREKFNDNKSAFARAAHCRESTIRRIFKNDQSITIPLLLRLCAALEVEPSELLKGIRFVDKDGMIGNRDQK